MIDWPTIIDAVQAVTGTAVKLNSLKPVGGGSINTSWLLGRGASRVFIKTNRAALLPMFEAERLGLEQIISTGAVRAPRPLCSGVAGASAYLVLEHIEFGYGADAAESFGRQLAAMHRTTGPRFGWRQDNTIGSTPQQNTESDSWPDFWRRRRLGFQLQLAAENGYRGSIQIRGEQLMARLDQFFSDYEPVPSLLHGDLWGGNFAIDCNGVPVIFDPAVYFGDREADIAMTELFGGFDRSFYAAYNESWPLDTGYPARRTLYNLYHILNHLNLFGGGYLGQAERMIEELFSATN